MVLIQFAKATVWQDLDNDGVLDAGEPKTTSDWYGNFNLGITNLLLMHQYLLKMVVNTDTGLTNKAVLKINSNLKEVVNRDWGEYTLSPSSSVSLSMQNLDRSIDDKQSTLDILKAFDMDPLCMKETETFMVRDFGISKITSRSLVL